MVQKPPCWRSNYPLGHPKQKNIKLSCFVLDVPVGSLLSSMAVFVPCDRKLQRACSVCNHTRDKQIGLPRILLSLVWLQTELDSTQSYYQYLSFKYFSKHAQFSKLGNILEYSRIFGWSVSAILVTNRVWILHCSPELGMFLRGRHFFLIIDKTNKSPSQC